MSALAGLAAQVNNSLRVDSDEEKLSVIRVALGDGASLPEPTTKMLCELTGWSRATLHRRKAKILAERPPEPPPLNAFESLDRHGAAGFYFDEEMLVVYRLSGCDQKRLANELKRAGYPRVSPATMSRRFNDLAPRIRDGLVNGHKNRYKFQLTRRFETSAPYELFQVDEFVLPIEVLVPLGRLEKWTDKAGKVLAPIQPDGPGTRRYKRVQLRLLVLIDSYSRFVMAYAVLTRAATMYDTLALYGDALLQRTVNGRAVGGAPDAIGTDNGGALIGHLVADFVGLLPASLDIALGYSPQSPEKAKIEANGARFQNMLVTGLPGQRTAAQTRDGYDLAALDPIHLLTFDSFLEHAELRMNEWNFEIPHGSTGEVPFERLTSNGVTGDPVADEHLAMCFLPNDLERPNRLQSGGRRAVDKEGVRLHDGTHHQCVEFFDHIGTQVEIRTLHHRCDIAAAFDLKGDFIGFTKHESVWTKDDDRRRTALSRKATGQINRVHRRAADYTASIARSDPAELAHAAAQAAIAGADVVEAKRAKRDASRPNDVGPRRREASRDAAAIEAELDTTNLEASLEAARVAQQARTTPTGATP